MELALRESESSWKEFIAQLRERGLRGVELVISDHHAGLRKAIAESLPEAVWQRCLYERHNIEEAEPDLTAWLQKWVSAISGSAIEWKVTSSRPSASIGCPNRITNI